MGLYLYFTKYSEYLEDLDEWMPIFDSFIYASTLDDANEQLQRHVDMLMSMGMQIKDWEVLHKEEGVVLCCYRPDTVPAPYRATGT